MATPAWHSTLSPSPAVSMRNTKHRSSGKAWSSRGERFAQRAMRVPIAVCAMLLISACAHNNTSSADNAAAQVGHAAKPSGLALIEQFDLPPLPAGKTASDFVRATEVVTRKTADETITEYRFNGKAFKLVVKPNKGAAYTLVDEKGDGKFVRQGELGGRISVPMWLLFSW
jgi:hypothetical protein